MNFFQPSFKLLRKERVGARVRKTYRTPATPADRLLSSSHVDDAAKKSIRTVSESLDPLSLLSEIRMMQQHLASHAAGATDDALPTSDPSLERFFASLESAWTQGEVRPTHQAEVAVKTKAERAWRTRKDPFEAVWDEVLEWLEAVPDSSAKDILERLQGVHPGKFSSGQLRSLQRRVREWRAVAVRQLIIVGGRSAACQGDNPKELAPEVFHNL